MREVREQRIPKETLLCRMLGHPYGGVTKETKANRDDPCIEMMLSVRLGHGAYNHMIYGIMINASMSVSASIITITTFTPLVPIVCGLLLTCL